MKFETTLSYYRNITWPCLKCISLNYNFSITPKGGAMFFLFQLYILYIFSLWGSTFLSS